MQAASQHSFQVLTKRPERAAELAHKLPWPDNVWMGTTVESADYLYRIRSLVQIPVTVRFLSLEPLLGPLTKLPLKGIHWVIVGGESGPDARPMQSKWVFQIREQCQESSVPFFFKQWGGVNKKKNGRLLDGKICCAIPSLNILEEVKRQNVSLSFSLPI